jgi:hypothetical protein
MSFFIFRAGYDIKLKLIKNVFLMKTNTWQRGFISLNDGRNICQINSENENKVEMIRYNNKHALLLNSMIIYENAYLFTYCINLSYKNDINDINDIDLRSIDFTYLNYNDMTTINPIRQLN